MKTFKYILISITILVFIMGCSSDTDRRIKLASKPTNGLMKDRVETITIAASQKKSVAIFHFLNDTANEELEWLEKGIVEMLSTDLSQARQLYVIPLNYIQETMSKSGYSLEAIADTNVAANIARQLNSEAFICGNYAIDGDSLAINIELRDGFSGALINKTAIRGGGIENVFTMINTATRQLRSDLQLTFRDKSEVDERLADFTTSSLDAYKYFTLGEAEMTKLKLMEAKPYFLKAITEDTTFSSAFYMLAYIHVNSGRMDSARYYIYKALRLLDKSPVKEKLYIQSLAAIVDGDLAKAAQFYQQLTEEFPEDDEAHYFLGNYYYGAGNDIEKAVAQFEAAIALNPNNKLALNMLGYSYEEVERLDYAINIFEKYTQLASDEPNPFDSYGEVLLRKGRLDDAIDKFKTALEIDPDFHASALHLVRAYLDKADYKNAQKEMKILDPKLTDSNDRYRFHLTRAVMFVQMEKIDSATKEAKKAYELEPYRAGAIMLLYNIDKDRNGAVQRLQKWVDSESAGLGQKEITFDILFTLASLSLYFDADIEQVDQLLSNFMENNRGVTLFLAAVAFKQIYTFQTGAHDESLINMYFENFQPESFAKMPPIGWNVYWKYYFPSIQKVIENGNMPDTYLEEYRDFCGQNKNLHFEIQACYAVALKYLLESNISVAKKQLHAIGASMESNWQIIGPFKVSKGFHEKFWPEKKHIEEVLDKWEEDEWVDKTDNIADGYIDLTKITGSEFNTASYAILPINVPSSRDVQLRFGSGGPIKVWLNNEPVLVKNMYAVPTLDSYIVNARLHEGTNYLLIKVNYITGENGFYFRLTDQEGYGFYDISFGEWLET